MLAGSESEKSVLRIDINFIIFSINLAQVVSSGQRKINIIWKTCSNCTGEDIKGGGAVFLFPILLCIAFELIHAFFFSRL